MQSSPSPICKRHSSDGGMTAGSCTRGSMRSHGRARSAESATAPCDYSYAHRGLAPERTHAREPHRLRPDLIAAHEHIRQPMLVIWLRVVGPVVRTATLASFERTMGCEFGH